METSFSRVINDARKKKKSKPRTVTIGNESGNFAEYKIAQSDPNSNKNRRAIILTKKDDSWGFTLQTYGIHQKKTDTLEIFTYVDYVEFLGPAHVAGMRPGDVILSINGRNMENSDHAYLVKAIRQCGDEMRTVVLFEDCVKKVELHRRYLKLNKILADKMKQLQELERKERRILDACFNRPDNGSMNNHLRWSLSSFDSSCSDSTTASNTSEFSCELGSDISPLIGGLCASSSSGNITTMQGHVSPMLPLHCSPALSASPIIKRGQFAKTLTNKLTHGDSAPCLTKRLSNEDFPSRQLNRNLSKSCDQRLRHSHDGSTSSSSWNSSQNSQDGLNCPTQRTYKYVSNRWSFSPSGTHSSVNDESDKTVKSGRSQKSAADRTPLSSYDTSSGDSVEAEGYNDVFSDTSKDECPTYFCLLQHINEETEITYI